MEMKWKERISQIIRSQIIRFCLQWTLSELDVSWKHFFHNVFGSSKLMVLSFEGGGQIKIWSVLTDGFKDKKHGDFKQNSLLGFAK